MPAAKPKIVVKCENCGSEIKKLPSQIRNNKKSFCNAQCKTEWLKRGTQEIPCANCGKLLTVRACEVRDAKFCNKACMSEWRKNHWRGKNSPAYKGRDRVANCSNCGKQVQRSKATLNIHTFCSQECKAEWQKGKPARPRNRITVHCDYCGKEMERTPSTIKDRNFCSRKCSDKGRLKVHNAPKNRPPHYGEKVEVTCTTCGCKFVRSKKYADTYKNKFCSNKCQGEWRSKNKTGENHPQWKGGRVMVECAYCGKQITRVRAEVENRSEMFFCNTKCHGKWRSENKTGVNHPNWRGGWCPYYGPNWARQRIEARKRDNYHCQYCGKSEKANGKRLDVHHIVPFRKFKYVSGENENYKEANKLSNLISLCVHCHKKAEAGLIPIQPKLC